MSDKSEVLDELEIVLKFLIAENAKLSKSLDICEGNITALLGKEDEDGHQDPAE